MLGAATAVAAATGAVAAAAIASSLRTATAL